MSIRTVNNLPAATHGETVRCLFAIELSKQNWLSDSLHRCPINRRTLKGCDWKGLLGLIGEMRARVSRETGRAVEVVSCYEAGYDGFWLHRRLEAHGIRNYIIDPASLQVDRRARRAKTDRSSGCCARRWLIRAVSGKCGRGAGAQRCRRGRAAAAPRA
jgi:transposase